MIVPKKDGPLAVVGEGIESLNNSTDPNPLTHNGDRSTCMRAA